jgi:hypothetical protein
MADVNKEIALKVTTDTSQTTTALKSAEERLNEAKKAMIEMAMAGKQGSAEFRALAVEAGTLKGKLELVEQTVDGIGKSTNQIEVFSGAMQGLSAGFAIAQGTAALFAEGNEELQEALVKVQASMALLQGTEQAVQLLRKESAAGQAILIGLQKGYAIAVNIATAATRSFTAALASTGIGALVVGLGILIAKLLETEGATKKTTAEMERATEVQKLLGQQIDLTNEKRQAEINLMEATGATAQQVAAARLKIIGEQLAALDESIAKEKENIEALAGFEDSVLFQKRKTILADKELRQANLQADLLKQLDIIKAADEEEAKINGEKTQLQIDNSLKARQQIITDLEVEMNYRKEVGQSTLELEEKLLREKLSYAELTKTGVMQAQAELRLFLTRDSREEEARVKKEKEDKIKAAQEAKVELDKINNDNRRSKLTEYQREQEDFLAQRAKMMELMRASGASEIELQLFASNTAAMIRNAANEKEVEDAKTKEDKKLSNQKAAILASIEVAKMGLQGIADLAAFFAGESEAQQKKAFEIQKRINIATTIIDGVLSAQKAYASLIGTPIVGPVLAPIAAGAAIAASLARVRAIQSTTFGATSAPSSGGGGGTMPSSGGGQQQPPAAFSPNVTPTNPNGQPNPQGGQNGTTRVIVVESDIRRVTTRVDAAERFATFGN